MSNTIVFYDIPSKVPGSAWSLNTWKTRYSLNYKGLPFRTEWVEYPDIEALCKKLGVAPTSTRPDGEPVYTLPAIHDPSTNTAVSDSLLIAEYLDKAYPDAPKLFPNQSDALQFAFVKAHSSTLAALWQFAVPATNKTLYPPSEEYFRRTREARFGMTLEELLPSGDARQAQWELAKQGFGEVDAWMKRAPGGGPYVMGDTISFADFIIASHTIWLKKIWGEESPEWQDIKTWHGGRWDAHLKSLEKYEGII